MANINNKPCESFAQSLNPNSLPNSEILGQKLINISNLDDLWELLIKARALSAVALAYEDFSDLEPKIIHEYLWALDDFINKAYNIAHSFC